MYIGAEPILRHYITVYDCVTSVYPEYDWNIFDFKRVPNHYWKSKLFQKKFLDDFALKNSINTSNDWSKIKHKQIKQSGGSGLLNQYNNSLYKALKENYPDNNWNVFLSTNKLPRGFWNDTKNHRLYLDHFAEQNNINSPEDWANVSQKSIKKQGGSGLLRYYNYNVFNALKSVYTEINWNVFSSTTRLPKSFWQNPTNHRKFLDNFASKRNINTVEEWSLVTAKDIIDAGGSSLLRFYPNFYTCLSTSK